MNDTQKLVAHDTSFALRANFYKGYWEYLNFGCMGVDVLIYAQSLRNNSMPPKAQKMGGPHHEMKSQVRG